MGVTIRRARRGDRDAVARLLHTLNPEAEPHQHVRTERRLRRDRAVTVLVAEAEDGRVVGITLGRRGLMLGLQRDAMRFDGVAVEPELRNTGIMTRLLNALDHEAARQDCSSLLGSVAFDRPELHELYRGRDILPGSFQVFSVLPPPAPLGPVRRLLRSLTIRWDRRAARHVAFDDVVQPSGLAGEGSDVVWWDPATLRGFLDATEGRPGHLLWCVAAATGAGVWELSHLRWDEVHLDHLQLPTAARPDGIPAVDGHRRVPLDAGTGALLAAHRPDGDQRALVFGDAAGERRRSRDVAAMFAADVGIAELRTVSVTVLRHTHAVTLLRSGVTIDRVAERLGHHPLQTAAAYRVALGDADLDPTVAWSAAMST